MHTPLANPSRKCVGPQAQYFGKEVHTDVWGPSPVTSKCWCKYFITFTDDATHYLVTYLLHTKAEAFGTYKAFEALALTQQHCATIKILCLDSGGEYLSEAFDQHLKSAGTAQRLTVHDTPQLNGVAERLNCTLVKRIWVFTHSSGLPKFLLGARLWVMQRGSKIALPLVCLTAEHHTRHCSDTPPTCWPCSHGAPRCGCTTLTA